MKQWIVLLTAAVISCTGRQPAEHQENAPGKDTGQHVATPPLNNGSKWKADEATKKNVAAMAQVINDASYTDAAKRKQLYATMQAKIDTLVKDCRMKGAEHEALHVWLTNVIKDVKELNEKDDDYGKAHAALKKDVESFYQYFE